MWGGNHYNLEPDVQSINCIIFGENPWQDGERAGHLGQSGR